MTAPPSDLARFLRAYRRFLEHAAEAAELTPDELLRMKESETFFFVGTESPARAQATDSLQAVRARAEQLGDRESLYYALGLVLESIARSRELRRKEVVQVERVTVLEREVKRLREQRTAAWPKPEPEEAPPFYKPERRMVEFTLGTVPKRYLRRVLALRELEERSSATAGHDDPAQAIAALYERQLRRKLKARRKGARVITLPLRKRWNDIALPAPDQLDAAEIERFAQRISRALAESLAALAAEGPPKGGWGWTARDLGRVLARDLGWSVLATRALARDLFRWLGTEAASVHRFPWGSIHLVENRRLVIEEREEREPAAAPRLLARPVALFAAEAPQS